MFIKMEKEGCYQATVSYGDVKLKNGEFSIIVLSSKCYFDISIDGFTKMWFISKQKVAPSWSFKLL